MSRLGMTGAMGVIYTRETPRQRALRKWKNKKADIGLGRAIDIMACHRRIRPRENNVVDEMNTYNRTISMHKSKDKK